MSADRPRILVDTSVWIGFFREEGSGTGRALRRAVAQGTILLPRIVLAELIQGAKSPKELDAIEELSLAFSLVGESRETWGEAGRLAYRLKKKGKTIPLADCYIAALARENCAQVLTLDAHFADIAAAGFVALRPLSGGI